MDLKARRIGQAQKLDKNFENNYWLIIQYAIVLLLANTFELYD